MPEQCSTKREVPTDSQLGGRLNILRDQLPTLHIGEVGSIACCPSVAHFQGLAVDHKLKLRLDGQPFNLPASL